MGNEKAMSSNPADGFHTDGGGAFTGGEGRLLEDGPLRWRFVGEVVNAAHGAVGTMEYILEKGEPVVRMRFTGKTTATPVNSVVTRWSLVDAAGSAPANIVYGTPSHWHARDLTTFYWYGPTFVPTHNYVMAVGSDARAQLGTFYHLGVPSWTLDGGQILGILLRSPGNFGGGLDVSDVATHVQDYAFRLPGVGAPDTAQPLAESLAFQLRQQAARVPDGSKPYPLAESAQLASPAAGSAAVLRTARTQAGSGGAPTNQGPSQKPLPFSFVLRLYQATNATSGTFAVTLPWLPAGASAEIRVGDRGALRGPGRRGGHPADPHRLERAHPGHRARPGHAAQGDALRGLIAAGEDARHRKGDLAAQARALRPAVTRARAVAPGDDVTLDAIEPGARRRVLRAMRVRSASRGSVMGVSHGFTATATQTCTCTAAARGSRSGSTVTARGHGLWPRTVIVSREPRAVAVYVTVRAIVTVTVARLLTLATIRKPVAARLFPQTSPPCPPLPGPACPFPHRRAEGAGPGRGGTASVLPPLPGPAPSAIRLGEGQAGPGRGGPGG